MISLDCSGKMILGVSNVSATVDTHFLGLEVIGFQTGTGMYLLIVLLYKHL